MGRLEKISALAKELQVDAILITSEVNMQYATLFWGFEGSVIVGADGEAVCFTDSRYIESAQEKITPLGYRVVMPEQTYPTPETVRDYIQERKYTRVAYEDQRMSVAQFEVYRTLLDVELTPLGDALERVREVKEDQEIQWITQAQRIAEHSLEKLLPEIRPGAYEDELCAKLRYYMAMEGSTGFAPGMILVAGTTTSMPHGQPSHKQVQTGDFVTIDFGAEVKGYQSDMTRTFAIGYATERMKEIYQIVADAQAAGIEAFAVGKSGREVDAAARSVIENAGYGKYFGHSVGHSLGLEIHENPKASKRYEGRYQVRNITTIEPGIYIPGEFGVRIEDMIYLSPEGKVNLTEFPKELTIL